MPLRTLLTTIAGTLAANKLDLQVLGSQDRSDTRLLGANKWKPLQRVLPGVRDFRQGILVQ